MLALFDERVDPRAAPCVAALCDRARNVRADRARVHPRHRHPGSRERVGDRAGGGPGQRWPRARQLALLPLGSDFACWAILLARVRGPARGRAREPGRQSRTRVAARPADPRRWRARPADLHAHGAAGGTPPLVGSRSSRTRPRSPPGGLGGCWARQSGLRGPTGHTHRPEIPPGLTSGREPAERLGGVDDATADEREVRAQRRDRVLVDAEVVVVQHRDVGQLAGRQAAAHAPRRRTTRCRGCRDRAPARV